MTLFTYSSEYGLVSKIFTLFLKNGWESIIRIILQLLIENEKKLLPCDFEGCINILKFAAEDCEDSIVEKSVNNINFSEEEKNLINSVYY